MTLVTCTEVTVPLPRGSPPALGCESAAPALGCPNGEGAVRLGLATPLTSGSSYPDSIPKTARASGRPIPVGGGERGVGEDVLHPC